jgi:histidinol-phosphate aminotransferase
MSRFFDPKLARLAPYTPGEQPRGIQNLIKLNTNESPFPPSPAVLAAIDQAQVEALRLYSDPTCDGLVRAIADFYDLAPEQVFPGNGSDEVLAFCFHGLCPKGAAFPDISYGFYTVFADMFGVKATAIPLRDDFSILPADYAAQRGTVFIANPNAPTGLCLSLSQIRELLEQDPGRLVVVDEAYVDFGGESAAALLDDYENLLVIQTFSKSRQLAGGRVGFALGSRALIADLNALRFSFNPYNLNRLSLLAGEAAMRDRAYFDQTRHTIMENRAHTTVQLRGLGFRVLESRANFIFTSHPALPGGEYYAALRQRGILVRHFDKDRIRDFVRITIGTAAQMDTLLAATKEILKERNAL